MRTFVITAKIDVHDEADLEEAADLLSSLGAYDIEDEEVAHREVERPRKRKTGGEDG